MTCRKAYDFIFNELIEITMTGGCTSCINEDYLTTFEVTGGSAPYTLEIIDGDLPEGLVFDPETMTISGQSSVPGFFELLMRATDVHGTTRDLLVTLAVLGITTTALAHISAGIPYSFQMEATGGSGNYGWTIPTGTLPDGLNMSESGLISGTPTNDSSVDLTFHVVDLDCGPFIPEGNPRISFETSSFTVIKTMRGFPPYIAGPELYKKATYSGTHYQTAYPNWNVEGGGEWIPPGGGYPGSPLDEELNNTACAGARFDYSEHDEIDIYGNIIHRHKKDEYLMCNSDISVQPLYELVYVPGGVQVFPFNNPGTVIGFCWPPMGGCPTCDPVMANWAFTMDRAQFGTQDLPRQMLMSALRFTVSNATQQTYLGEWLVMDTLQLSPNTDPDEFPRNDGLGIYVETYPFIRLYSFGDWNIELSEQYTDEDAEASKVTYSSNSRIAENLPDHQIWTQTSIVNRESKTTTVDYSVTARDLLVGRTYDIIVTMVNNAFVTSTVVHEVLADSTTEVVTGSIPFPAEGETIELKSVTVQFHV